MTTVKDLTPAFRHVRLVLAREKGSAPGGGAEGYDLLVPLDAEGRLLPQEWKSHQSACRVRHFRTGQEDRIGQLRRKAGGQWYFDYVEGESDDEIGFRFSTERFVVGEYVSVTSSGKEHTYQVERVVEP